MAIKYAQAMGVNVRAVAPERHEELNTIYRERRPCYGGSRAAGTQTLQRQPLHAPRDFLPQRMGGAREGRNLPNVGWLSVAHACVSRGRSTVLSSARGCIAAGESAISCREADNADSHSQQ